MLIPDQPSGFAFIVDKLLVTGVIKIERKKKANLEKYSKHLSVFRLSSVASVEKTATTSSSLTHTSEN